VLSPAQQEGPYFSPGSPQRDSLIDEGMPGVPVLIYGRVFDQDCNPIPEAKLDFWLADVNGEYDNVGYTLRGHVFTSEDGYYQIESIEPTSYTGRPPHIHVKVYSPGGEELLTTQMYFAGSQDSAEVRDNPVLFVTYLEADEDGGLQVLFNFVVRN
jgi:protocatechuate 3,4-dioxygenase beta subunit